MQHGIQPPLHATLIAPHLGSGKLGSKALFEFGIVIAETNSAHPAFGSRDQHPAERRCCDRVVDTRSLAPFPISGGGHTKALVTALVDTAGGSEAGFVNGVGHR